MLDYETREKLTATELEVVEWAETLPLVGEFRCRHNGLYQFAHVTISSDELMRRYRNRPRTEILDFREVPAMDRGLIGIIIGVLVIIVLVIVILQLT